MSNALDKLNTFIERFRHDYTIGKIDIGKYGAYLKWKFEDSPLPSFYEVVDMAEKVSDDLEKYDIKYPGAASYTEPYLNDDPWQSYKMYEDDKYIVSYLSYMEGELLNLQVSGLLSRN